MTNRLHILTSNWTRLIPLLLLLLALAIRTYEPALVTQLRLAIFDQYQSIKPRGFTPLPVRIVDIDEESLKRLGQWPWPRDMLAQMVSRAAQAGAAAVVLDVLLAEPDRLSPSNWLRLLPAGSEYENLRKALTAQASPDQILADSLGSADTVVGFALTAKAGTSASGGPVLKGGFAEAGDPSGPFMLAFGGHVPALAALQATASGYGALSLVPDSDGVVRRAPLFVTVADKVVPSIDAEALRVAQGASTYVVKSTNASGEASWGGAGGVVSARIGALTVPTDRHGRVWIRYAAQLATTVPAWQLLNGDVDPAALAGHIVLLGSTAAGLARPQPTPLGTMSSAIQIRAQLLETLISEHFLERPDWANGAEILLALVLGLALLWLLPKWGPLWCALIALAAVGSAIGGSWLAFAHQGLLLDPAYFSCVILVVYLAQSLKVYFSSESERRYVRSAFSRYLSPALVEDLARDPARLRLGGETRDLSIMFCDIRGFTKISERYSPQDLTRLINRFLTPLTQAILDRKGTIDKYMGDCIMAFWNAPITVPGHAREACHAALAMLEALAALNRELSAEDADNLRIGIGINTGSALVGNLGSEQRFDYSVLGDAVNLASRLEGQSKTYGVDVLLNENVVDSAPAMATLELDLVQVVGKSEPARIFTLLGDETLAASPAFQTLRADQARMLGAYRAREWDEACQVLDQLRQSGWDALDGYFTMFRERVQAFKVSPPGSDWDGVERRLSK
jgi:adenylate cyclase